MCAITVKFKVQPCDIFKEGGKDQLTWLGEAETHEKLGDLQTQFLKILLLP